MVGDLLELAGLYGEEILELVDLFSEVLGDIGHGSCHDCH